MALTDIDGQRLGDSVAPKLSNRNKIINGDMRIDQRNAGTAVTLTAANFVYPVDRFFAFRTSGTSGATAQQVSGSITGGNALRVQRTSGNAATDALGFGQVIESANCAGFAGNNITLSFRARCGANFSAASSQITARVGTGNGTDQSSADFYNFAWTGQSTSNTLITLTTSWQTFTVTVAAGSSVNQAGIQFYWTPSGTAGADDWVEIEQIQLEIGNTATPFEHRTLSDELTRCQRYYQGWRVVNYQAGYSVNARGCGGWVSFNTEMRDDPATINTSAITYVGASGLSPQGIIKSGFGCYYVLSADGTNRCSFTWNADVEL